jgi:hypothetical protein
MTKFYDATKEHAPFDRSKKTDGVKRHPNKNADTKHPVTGK